MQVPVVCFQACRSIVSIVPNREAKHMQGWAECSQVVDPTSLLGYLGAGREHVRRIAKYGGFYLQVSGELRIEMVIFVVGKEAGLNAWSDSANASKN